MSVRHPLEPLSREEIQCAVRVVRDQCGHRLSANIRFCSATLWEPESKQDVWDFEAAVERGDKPNALVRLALLIIFDIDDTRTYECLVDVEDSVMVSLIHVPDVQAALAPGEYTMCEEALMKDRRFLEALRRRGIDPQDVIIECWTVGHFDERDDPNRRLARPLLYVRSPGVKHGNAYARPVDNLCPVFDLAACKMLWIDDSGRSALPIPPPHDEYTEFGSDFHKLRTDVKPLEIVQPEGASFHVHGSHVQWLDHSFRVGFTQREGLVLYNMKVKDPKTRENRTTIYRFSFSEMVVPYGSPAAPNVRKNAFDAGEDGLGNSANSLALGCDCLGAIHYFDAHILDCHGEVQTIKNAICLHEEDDGILWKHTDWRSSKTEVRRARKLVISFFCTVANYDYGFYINIRQDGVIHPEVKMTGILSTSALMPSEITPKYGTRVAPQLNAPIHQHFFTVRMVMAVDGEKQRVYELNVQRETLGTHNPEGNAFFATKTLLRSEQEAMRDVNHSKARHWLVTSSTRRNRLNEETGYRLLPAPLIHPFGHPDTSVRQRASFLSRSLYVTPYSPIERFPSGAYPNQRSDSDGVAQWTKANRSLVDTEVVLWYTFGATHVVKAEDWPIMPTVSVGFVIEPCNFFNANPTLDAPESKSKCSVTIPDDSDDNGHDNKIKSKL